MRLRSGRSMIQFRYGSEQGSSLRIRFLDDGWSFSTTRQKLEEFTIETWTGAIVAVTFCGFSRKSLCVSVIVPRDDVENKIENRSFLVVGQFEIVKKFYGAKASEAWKNFTLTSL